MTSKLAKSGSKGQITLPKEWRDKFQTHNFIIEIHEEKVEIKPLMLENSKEEIIFDAERDNGGKGFSPEEMITLLKKVRHG